MVKKSQFLPQKSVYLIVLFSVVFFFFFFKSWIDDLCSNFPQVFGNPVGRSVALPISLWYLWTGCLRWLFPTSVGIAWSVKSQMFPFKMLCGNRYFSCLLLRSCGEQYKYGIPCNCHDFGTSGVFPSWRVENSFLICFKLCQLMKLISLIASKYCRYCQKRRYLATEKPRELQDLQAPNRHWKQIYWFIYSSLLSP